MILLGIGLLIASYLSVDYIFHTVIFSEYNPYLDNYFETGDTFKSELGRNRAKIIDREDGKLDVETTFEPHADGPPMHVHTSWDEHYHVKSGELTLIINGETKKLGPGDQYLIENGVPHKVCNPSGQPVVAKFKIPPEFVMHLSQVYGFMDEDEKNVQPPRMI